MEIIFFIISNIAFYSFLYYVLCHFSFLANLSSAWILLVLSLIVYLPPFIMLYFIKKDRKKFFIFSSIWTTIISLLFFLFGANILSIFTLKEGLINYTIYIYKYLFMFAPISGLFFIGIHKIFAKKKQLFFIIAFKYILPIFIGLILMHFLAFYKLLWLLAIIDFCSNIFSIWLSSRKD